MNRDEKFVMEKLRELDDAETVEPSDELRERLARIKFPEKPASVSAPAKRSWRVPVFSALSAVVTACVIILCCIFLPLEANEDFIFDDKNLELVKLSYEEFTTSHNMLLLNQVSENSKISIYQDKKSKTLAYCLIDTTIETATLKTQIVFVNNYTIAENDKYIDLPLSSSTELFPYLYSIQNNTAYAFCEYGGYRYYFRYTADNPQAITEIMNNLQYHTN